MKKPGGLTHMHSDIYISDIAGMDVMKHLLSQYVCGIETIALGTSGALDHAEQAITKLRRETEELDHPGIILHGPFLDLNPMSYDSLIQKAVKTRFDQTYEAAKAVGAEKIIFHSGMIPTVYFLEGWAERMAEFWKTFLSDKEGIMICMENVLDQEIEPVLQVYDAVDHPNFGLCLDIGHANCYSAHKPMEWVREMGRRISHVHLHNNDGKNDLHDRITRGMIPCADVIREIRQTTDRCSWTIECFTEEDLAASMEALLTVLLP